MPKHPRKDPKPEKLTPPQTAPPFELPNLWLPHEITREEALLYDLGPLEVVLARRAKEFRFYYKYAKQLTVDELPKVRKIPTSLWREARRAAGDRDPYERFRITGDSDPGRCDIQLHGRCADRPFVARPRSQVQITSGNSVELFVTTPVWIEFEEIRSSGVIHALPTVLPRRTWLGPPDGTGPLCYSTMIHARLNYEDIQHHTMRVITHVVIQNDAPRVSLERVVIPAPVLQVFINERGELWTETVAILRTKEGDFSKIKVKHAPPPIAGPCRLLSGRREKLPDPLSVQGVVQTLFHSSNTPNIQYNG